MLDSFGRKIDYLRISVTDRCDLRCKYCMPQKMTFNNNEEILSVSDLKTLIHIFVSLGIKKIKVTGGEPLVRKNVHDVFSYLYTLIQKDLLKEVSITSNGTQLEKNAEKLKKNGIKRINISLDSLIEEKYNFITNGGNLKKVLNGIFLARELGFKIKINTVLIKDFNEDEIISLCKWCSVNHFKISFIETMPLGQVEQDRALNYFPSFKAMEIIEKEFGLVSSDFKSNGPSRYFMTEKIDLIVGFISPISNNFCKTCNRIRLTSNGLLFGCLGDNGSIDVKKLLLKNNYTKLYNAIKIAIFNKPEKHFFQINNKVPAVERFMNLTGG